MEYGNIYIKLQNEKFQFHHPIKSAQYPHHQTHIIKPTATTTTLLNDINNKQVTKRNITKSGATSQQQLSK